MPKRLDGLAGLEDLQLVECFVAGDLRALSGLQNLTRLVLDEVQLADTVRATAQDVCQGIYSLTRLMNLDLVDFPCGMLDVGRLSALSCLTSLVLQGLGLHHMHFTAGLRSLQVLSLRCNHLKCLPTGLSLLPELSQLDMSKQDADFQLGASLDFLACNHKLRVMDFCQSQAQHSWNAESLFVLVDAEQRLATRAGGVGPNVKAKILWSPCQAL